MLYFGKGVLIPLAAAFLISFVLNPFITWVARRGIPRLMDYTNDFVVGQSKDLLGDRTNDGLDMIVMPRDETIFDLIIRLGERLIICDTQHVTRFSKHPVTQLWGHILMPEHH